MDGTPELLLVLALSAGLTVAWALAFHATLTRRQLGLGGLGLMGLVSGAIGLRWVGSISEPRGRLAGLLAGIVAGVGAATVSAWPASESQAPRRARGAAVLPLAVGAASSGVVLLAAGRGGAEDLSSPLARVALAGWALGAAAVGLPFPSTERFAIVALAIGTSTVGAAAARSPIALGPMLAVNAALAAVFGVLSVKADPGEAPEAPGMRGFFVATVLSLLGAASVGHWWARGVAALPAAAAGAGGSALVLLLGRYHDDPARRPARALTEARTLDGTARWGAGALVGLEAFLVVVAVAALAAVASVQVDPSMQSASLAMVLGGALGPWALLRSLATGAARAPAHHALLLAWIAVGVAIHSRIWPIASTLALATMLGSIVVERTSTTWPPGEEAARMRAQADGLARSATLLSAAAVALSVLAANAPALPRQ